MGVPPTALFESWRGKYADSPRAISERLTERYPALKQVWVVGDQTDLPSGIRAVRRHSPKYFALLSTADFVVSNDIISRHYVKSRKGIYVQTWHGTPLKAIGHDEVDQKYDGAAAHFARMTRDVDKWDVLLSPSNEISEILKRAFRFQGTILETGLPRNDILRAADASDIRDRTRVRLGIEPEMRAILYAPTWRDDSSSKDGFRDPGALNAKQLLELCPNSVILNRMHSVVSTRIVGSDRIIDVSDHPEIAELYLASDVLVSDYSSAIFDYAVTGKPIVHFAYDLEHYRSSLRPFYFEYEEWAPGPIAFDTPSLAKAILSITPPSPSHTAMSEQYREFVKRFCPHEDGHASDRVIDAVFRSKLEMAK